MGHKRRRHHDSSLSAAAESIAVPVDPPIDPALAPPAQRSKTEHHGRHQLPSFMNEPASHSVSESAFALPSFDFQADMAFLNVDSDAAPDSEALMRALQAIPSSSSSHSVSNSAHDPSPASRPPDTKLRSSPVHAKPVSSLNPSHADLESEIIIDGKPVNPVHLLSCKWYSSQRLNQMAREYGLQYKKGKFTKSEVDAIAACLQDYKTSNNLDDDGLHNLIFSKKAEQRGNFWRTVALSTPGRPVLAVYNHVQRTQDPRSKKGFWKPEEDADLRAAVEDLGSKWQKVAERVGRTAGDCKDRYRNYVSIEASRKTGPWTQEEEEALKQAVQEVQGNLDKLEDKEVMWGVVAEKLGHTRSRQQCRAKWYDTHDRENVERDKWSKQDDYIFIQRLAAISAKDASEVDWKKIPDGSWNKFRSHKLREHWRNFRKRVLEANPGIHKDDFRSIVRILKAEQDAKVDHEGNVMGSITKAGGAPKSRTKPPTSSVDVDDTFTWTV